MSFESIFLGYAETLAGSAVSYSTGFSTPRDFVAFGLTNTLMITSLFEILAYASKKFSFSEEKSSSILAIPIMIVSFLGTNSLTNLALKTTVSASEAFNIYATVSITYYTLQWVRWSVETRLGLPNLGYC